MLQNDGKRDIKIRNLFLIQRNLNKFLTLRANLKEEKEIIKYQGHYLTLLPSLKKTKTKS